VKVVTRPCPNRDPHPGRSKTSRQPKGKVVNAVHVNRPLETRAARIALSLIRNPRTSLGYPARHERLVTAKDLALLAER
jgi:hypothetical protein